MVFEEAGDAERMFERIELRGLLEDSEPLLIGVAGLVGVGEDDDLVIDKRGEEFRLEHLETTTRHPDEVLDNLGENDRSLLGLDNTDG